jgi:hypothetical protein
MGVISKKLARGLNEPNGSGLNVLRVEGCEQVETDGAPSASRKLTQELPIVAEVNAQAFRDREDNLAMRYFLEKLLGGEVDPDQLALLMAARAQAPLPATEGDSEAAATLSAIQTGEALFQDSTIQEPEDRLLHDLPQEAKGRLEAFFIDLLESLEVMSQCSVEHRELWPTTAVDLGWAYIDHHPRQT